LRTPARRIELRFFDLAIVNLLPVVGLAKNDTSSCRHFSIFGDLCRAGDFTPDIRFWVCHSKTPIPLPPSLAIQCSEKPQRLQGPENEFSCPQE
jgi:hypothetical protein